MYQSNWHGYSDAADKHDVIINGDSRRYEKKFTLDDLSYLGYDSHDVEVFDVHNEKVVLDFSNFETGDIIEVTFSYGVFYYKDNPFNQAQPDNSWAGMRKFLYFYVEEDGVSVGYDVHSLISNRGEDEETIEMGHNPPENVCCAAK